MPWQLSFENAEVRRCGRCGHCGHHRHCSRISRGKLGVPSHWAQPAHCSGLHRTQLTRQPIELQCEKSSTVSTICPLSLRALHARWLKSFCSSLIREGRATQPHGRRPKIFSHQLRALENTLPRLQVLLLSITHRKMSSVPVRAWSPLFSRVEPPLLMKYLLGASPASRNAHLALGL